MVVIKREIKNFHIRHAILNILFIIFSVIVASAASSSAQNMPGEDIIEEDYEKSGYVWFETNAQSYLESYIQSAKQWETIGRPIATARIFNVEAFLERLNSENIFVTGGFKTSNALEGREYHDLEAWAEIARIARNVSELTNGKPVILENEGAVKKLLSKNITSIDYDALLKAISSQEWPEIWFWYAPTGHTEPLKTMSYDIARAVMNGISNARLIEHHSCGYASSPTNPHSKEALERTLTLDPHPISIIYLDNDTWNFWKLDDANLAIENAAGDTVILYPGHGDVGNSSEVINGFHPRKVKNLQIIEP